MPAQAAEGASLRVKKPALRRGDPFGGVPMPAGGPGNAFRIQAVPLKYQLVEKASQSFAPADVKCGLAAFRRGLYVTENASRGARVELSAKGGQPRCGAKRGFLKYIHRLFEKAAAPGRQRILPSRSGSFPGKCSGFSTHGETGAPINYTRTISRLISARLWAPHMLMVSASSLASLLT